MIKLQKGWWLFGVDCALSADIDIEQYKFFAEIADNVIGPNDAVIIVNHEPHWVTDFDNGKRDGELSEQNLSELMHTHLRGKVRLRIAGDLHHYTRHVPAKQKKSEIHRRRLRSYSFDDSKFFYENVDSERPEPFVEENKPELIVSGGGGAFLHGTHYFSKNIHFGEKKLRYSRICSYPSEKVSYLIGYVSMSKKSMVACTYRLLLCFLNCVQR